MSLADLDKIYYMRTALGIIAGIIAGIIIAPEFDQWSSVGVAFGIAAIFFIASVVVGRGMAKSLPQELRKKANYDGIIPFIFMNIVFIIIAYTALHQGSIPK